MFKLHRHRSSDRVGERFDFRFSNFRAVQVPAVSDRLFLSIVSVDNGKTIAKSSKVASRSGICQWPDTILEPIWFSKDEVSKEFEECQHKIIVSLGSTKSGILGEIFLNLSNFLNIVDPTAISLPLKRCNSGTVLQLKVQCLGTKSKLSGVRSLRDMAPRHDDRSPTPTNDEMDNRSDCSDGMFNKGVRSSSENHLGGTYQDESGNRETLRNGEEEKRNRIAMQAKLMRLESDLSASEASHVHEAELKNELSRIKRSNSEYQRKIQSLEQENEDLTRRVQIMEKGFEQMSHVKENLGKQEIGGDNQAAIQSKIQLLETKLAEALEENKMYRAQQKSPMPDGQSAGGDGKEGNTDRILQLEGELRDMKERLLNMSLQYAEVEAQRERLVMELKAIKKGRWF